MASCIIILFPSLNSWFFPVSNVCQVIDGQETHTIIVLYSIMEFLFSFVDHHLLISQLPGQYVLLLPHGHILIRIIQGVGGHGVIVKAVSHSHR